MSARHPKSWSSSGFRPGRTALLNTALIVLAVAALAVLAARHSSADGTVEVTRHDPPAGVDDLTVLVSGGVVSPGIVTAEPGDVVADVIERAGGALPGANLDGVNVGLRVRDGDVVHVPLDGEPAALLLDLNLASQAELEALPGIGPARAVAIIDARPLRDAHELLDQSLVPDNVWEEIRALVTTR